jgi:CHAT domain
MTQSDDDERQALIREKRRRLHQRELTAARYGINTPPEVAIEIEDLKREIAALERGSAAAPSAPGQQRAQPASPGAQPVLAIFAEPAGLGTTEREAEARVLRNLLLPFEAQFSLRELANITPEELFQALLTVRPGILHFQGHGTTDGLVFEDSQGDGYNVTWQALMDTLAACETLTCVVLNACDSYVHAQVGSQHFHLITTPGKVSTESTRAFTQGFYVALRAGRSVPQAHREACNLLGMKGIARGEWPTLTEGQGRRSP